MKEFKKERYILKTIPIFYAPLYKKDGSLFLSSDGFGRICTVTGATYVSTGRNFDGTDDIISIPDSDSLSALSKMTVFLWMNQDIQGAGLEGVLSKDSGATTNREFAVIIASGAVGIYFFTDSANDLAAFGTTDVSDTTWHSVAFTYNGVNAIGNIKVYVDGIIDKLSNDIKDGTGFVAHNGSYAVEIGRYGSTNAACFDGKIGDVIIYNKVLAQSQIAYLHNKTKWRYS